MNRPLKFPVLVLGLILGLCGTTRAANPLDNRVPKDTILYFGWSGSDAQQAAYNSSNLKQFVEASSASQYIAEQLPKLIQMAAQNDPSAPQIIAKLQAGLSIAWHHPVALYFCPMTFDNPQKPEFRFGILCDAGSDAASLSDLLKQALAGVPPGAPLPMNVTMDGNLVGLIFGKQQNAADRQMGGALNTDPEYVKAMAPFKIANPVFATYINFTRGMTMANEMLTKAPDLTAAERTKTKQIFELLGLNQLTQLAAVEGFDGKEWSGQSLMGVNGTPKGILKLFNEKPLSPEALAAVPKNAVMFSASKLDLPQVYQEARSIIGAIDASTLQQMDGALAQAKASIGLDLQKDVIDPLGDEWVIYRAPLSDLGGNSLALVHKLRDGDHFATTIAAAEEIANKAGAGNFKIDKMTEGGVQFSTVTYLNYSIAWTVRNGYLYVSSMDGLVGAVKQVEGKLPNITESDVYQKALATAGGANIKANSISYSDPGKTYPELRRDLVGMLPLLRPLGIDVPASILPDVEMVAPVMTPGAAVTWWDAQGLHQSSHSSFPGAEAIGGNSGGATTVVAVAALGTAVLLPSLGKARELANRSADAANLRGIAQSSIIFGMDSNKMPDDLAQLVANGQMSPKNLVSRRAGTAPLEMTAEVQQLAKDDFAKFSAQIAEHCDFVYLGKGTTPSMDAGVVIAYEKPGPWVTDGMNLAFGDGHVEFIRLAGLAEAFGPTNDMLKKKGLPTVDVDAILKASNVHVVEPLPQAVDPVLH